MNLFEKYAFQFSIDEPRRLVPKEYEKYQDPNENEKKQKLKGHEPDENPHFAKNENKMVLRELLMRESKLYMKVKKLTDFINRCARLMQTKYHMNIRVM